MADIFEALKSGLAHHQAGRLAEAEAAYRRALEIEPGHAYALYLFGLLQLSAGRLAAAIDLLRRSTEADPDSNDARFNLGNALYRNGDLAAAIDMYRDVVARRPGSAEGFANLARALKDAGRNDAAVAAARQAIELQPTLAEGHTNLGAALLALGDEAGALASFAAAAELQPKSAAARANLANALRRAGQANAAIAEARQAVALQPTLAEAHATLGMALRDSGDFSAAADALGRATALNPKDAATLVNLGNALMDDDRPEEAVAAYARATEAAPSYAEAQSNLGAALTALGRFDAAIAACDRAIALQPGNADAHWNQGFACLLAGDLAKGWEKYEWRKRHPRFAAAYRHFPEPVWEGGDIAGRTLLIHAEQGFGDSIQLVRYARPLAARGARIVMACDRALLQLFARAPGVGAEVDKAGSLPSFDLWIDQMSLPRVMATRIDSIPAEKSYLSVDPARVQAWRDRLPAGRKFGLVWAGNPTHSNDRRRSTTIEAVAPLLRIAGWSPVSLQVGARAGDRARAAGPLADVAQHLTDFVETAAAIANLDLVITVDTAVAHLAGALGVPVWVMLPFAPDWRWIVGRDDSPWYPTMRLYRQKKAGDWNDVVARIALALKSFY